jgi:hypothetical protein
MIVYTERRGGRVAYVDRTEYEFRPSFDEWGRFVVLLHATTDDELVHLQSRYFMFRLRDGATADDAKSLAVHLESVFEDVQMMWVEGGPDGGSRVPVVVPIRRAA